MSFLRKPTLFCCTLIAATAAAAWPQSFRVQDFGQVPANGLTPGTVTLVSASCTVAATTNCTLPVQFLPYFTGLRQDSLAVTDQFGTLLETVFLHGVGLGPQLSLYPGTITTFAGSGSWSYVDAASPSAAGFRNPTGLAIDASGNLYIADSINQAIRLVSAATGAVTTVAGTGSAGNSGNGGLATAATLNNPIGVALDAPVTYISPTKATTSYAR